MRLILTLLGLRSLILGMIWERIVYDPHFWLSLWETELGDYLSHLLPIYLASIIEIINVIVKIIAIFDCMAWSVVEWAVFGLVNVGWPRFSFFWETECIISHKDLKNISQGLRQWRIRLPL